MLYRSLIALSSLGAGLVAAQECPDLPPFELGPPVPQVPDDIPDGCMDHEILVARGTSEISFEPDGKFGVVVGDPVVSNVTKFLDNVQAYPVQYPASSDQPASSLQGVVDVVARLTSQAAKCPRQTFALVGYSQGAGVMHLATEQIPESLYPRIKALVMFGDPQLRRNGTFPAALQPKVLQNCAPGDPVCEEGAPCFYYHLVYIFPEWIDPSVEFIVHALNSTKCSLSTHWDSSQLA